MPNLNGAHQSLLQSHSRAIVHMRRQIQKNRFGLIFGSGISNGFQIPNWAELVKHLAADGDIEGKELLKVIPPRMALSYQTEMLFEHYRKKRYATSSINDHHTRKLDYQIGADWREKVRGILYKNIGQPLADLLSSHPYLEQYLPLIQRSQMTVTYNFDDFIEQGLLLRSQERNNAQSRGFESVTNTWTQFRRSTAVIYHPNGVVPQNPLESPSDRFVFTEASFAAQLMGIYAGDHAGLLNHLAKNTCLLIGLSLEDETLRNMLAHAARSCPGNYHYYVHFVNSDNELNDEEQHAIIKTNFKVYNLITLFLDDRSLKVLAELLDEDTCGKNEFRDFAMQHRIPIQFRFYLTGPMGVGKSTTINHLRNLVVLDEWLEERPVELAKNWSTSLSPGEKDITNNWIANQFKIKNGLLRHEAEGIYLLDRGPIDPLAFTPHAEWKEKASFLLRTICPNGAWKVEQGRVVMLKGDPDELSLRMIMTQRKDYKAADLADMEVNLQNAYGKSGVAIIETKGLAIAEVVRRLAEIIHLEDYEDICDLHQRLKTIESEGFDVAI